MASYEEFFKRGLANAKIAADNIEEIRNVFLDLDKQIANASDNKVAIERRSLNEPLEHPFIMTLGPRKQYQAIVARKRGSDEGERLFELARWQQAPGGYPCQIIREAEVSICENKQALEIALGNLLSDASVGAIFMKIVAGQSAG